MRGLVLVSILVFSAIGIGVAVVDFVSPSQAPHLAIDEGSGRLPAGLVDSASAVLVMAEHQDVGGLAHLAALGVSNNPNVFEAEELFAIRGEFGDLVGLLTTTPPIASPYVPNEYVWSAGESSWLLTRQTRPRALSPRFGGLELSFGLNQGRWELLEIDMPPAQTFASLGRTGVFGGAWVAHDRFLTVNPDGSVLLSARAFQCPSSSRKCHDHFVGNEIIDGENATGRITKIAGRTAIVDIGYSTLTAAFPLGRAKMTYDALSDSVEIGDFLSVCGPRGTPQTCGA